MHQSISTTAFMRKSPESLNFWEDLKLIVWLTEHMEQFVGLLLLNNHELVLEAAEFIRRLSEDCWSCVWSLHRSPVLTEKNCPGLKATLMLNINYWETGPNLPIFNVNVYSAPADLAGAAEVGSKWAEVDGGGSNTTCSREFCKLWTQNRRGFQKVDTESHTARWSLTRAQRLQLQIQTLSRNSEGFFTSTNPVAAQRDRSICFISALDYCQCLRVSIRIHSS